ncbi:MAG: dihydroxyacetone kinase phosphoryl donor subunit DhaM [Eubacteriales bacterium]|nr:dihydroxyacetone kinase phosphoryl donor subunit DhaM [Eubacteriales bacterium]
MVGIVIVSHSRLAAEGIRELAAQMAGPELRLIACGGLEDGSIGTDAMRIRDAIISADSGDGVCAMVDLGSGIMSTETAMELLEFDEDYEGLRVQIADAPVLEGSVSAAVSASAGDSLEEVVAAAEEARGMCKLSQ